MSNNTNSTIGRLRLLCYEELPHEYKELIHAHYGSPYMDISEACNKKTGMDTQKELCKVDVQRRLRMKMSLS